MATRSRLAVILHADVVGSTALVHLDERVAHDRFQDVFRRFSETIAKYSGRTHELRGDALIAQFERGSDAVSATLSFQAANLHNNELFDDDLRPQLRVGIALGEVVIANHTITGPGVVLAQRLEQLAEPGGLCISAAIRESVPSRLPFRYRPLDEQMLKGFDEPVRAFIVSLGEKASVPMPEPAARAGTLRGFGKRWLSRRVVGSLLILIIASGALLAWWLPRQDHIGRTVPSAGVDVPADRPSVAVLPFTDASGNRPHSNFADGVTEDIITDLSKVSGLLVMARGSTAEYKGSNVSAQRVAEKLGVRYILEGSVRRSGDEIRVTAQLVDTLHGNHLWAERYDRKLRDVFAVQSEVAAQVVKALAITLKSGELERLFQKYTANVDAYDVFIQARRTVDVPSRANVERGEALFKQVIELDPQFAGGYAGLSFNYSVKARFGYSANQAADAQRSLELARQAVQVDPQFAWSYVALGGAQLASGNPTSAVETMRQALVLLPGDYEVHLFSGLYLQFAGEPGEAIKHLELAKRMNPVDTDRNLSFMGMAYFMNKDYAKAEIVWTRRLEKFPAGSPLALVFMAATHALQGHSSEAALVAGRLRATFPDFALNTWGWSNTYRLAENRERLHRGAAMAGIP